MFPAHVLPGNRFAPRLAAAVWLLLALALVGCTSAIRPPLAGSLPGASLAGVAAAAQSQATLEEAQKLDRDGDPRSVDLYYLSALQVQQALAPAGAVSGSTIAIYRQALAGLIDAGQRYDRLDPRRQLTVVINGQTQVVPIRYFGFAWQAEDFSRLTPTESLSYRDIRNHYTTPGLGLPLVGERITVGPEEMFLRDWISFAVTALLRPADAWEGGGQVLEFYNPLSVDRANWCGASYPLARDLTAPLAATLQDVPRQYFRGFTAPTDTSVKPELTFVEPYQRGKIPVVLIHGLYSDPLTWVDMLNDLRAQPDLCARFQFWFFRYPTGGELLESAAVLRKQLCQARNTFDPAHSDPALDNMVLVGHSLGGLVSKLQITRSYDLLWREIADQPFDALRAPPQLEERAARDFFFEPVPLVKRVVFIGTPHHGSNIARRLAGCVGSALVSFGSDRKDDFREVIAMNECVFKPGIQNYRPTTVNLLDPDSPFLVAVAAMPINCQTRIHSIIGTGGHCGPPGDGVVPVTSARHAGLSELFVPAKHEQLHHDPASTAEVARILRLHAAEVGSPMTYGPAP